MNDKLSTEKSYAYAIFFMVGGIIGAGIFGVPYVLSGSGALLGTLIFLLVGFAILLTHLFYVEVVNYCGEKMRFLGYVGKILGPKFKFLSFFSITSTYLALLAYTLLGGVFLKNIFGNLVPVSQTWYQIIFFVICGGLVFLGLKIVERANFWGTFALIVTILVLIALSLLHLKPQNLTGLYYESAFVPFGVILFSLLGVSAVPEMNKIFGAGKVALLRSSVLGGTLVAILITYLFGFAVLGLTGLYTSSDAISGMAAVLGHKILIIGALMGIFAVATSFLVLAFNQRETLRTDFKITNLQAWVYTFLPVMVLFIVTPRDFIKIMGVTGSIFGGITCFVIALMYRKLLSKKISEARIMRLPRWLVYFVMIVFLVGIVAEIASFLRSLV
jgi:amino acid permease